MTVDSRARSAWLTQEKPVESKARWSGIPYPALLRANQRVLRQRRENVADPELLFLVRQLRGGLANVEKCQAACNLRKGAARHSRDPPLIGDPPRAGSGASCCIPGRTSRSLAISHRQHNRLRSRQVCEPSRRGCAAQQFRRRCSEAGCGARQVEMSDLSPSAVSVMTAVHESCSPPDDGRFPPCLSEERSRLLHRR